VVGCKRELVRRWPAPAGRATFIFRCLPIRCATLLRNSRLTCQYEYATTETAVRNGRCCHTASLALTTRARKNLSSLACFA
jgi:hypothetical protein